MFLLLMWKAITPMEWEKAITLMEIRNLVQTPTLDQKTRKIQGTAVVFNQRSEDLGGFVEEVDPHAFDGVDTSDVKLLYNHNSGDILARTSADTLTLTVDDKGVEFEASIPETTLGNDTITNIENRNVQGMSFGFTIDDEDWINQSDGTLLHVIRKVGKLYELSLTPFPAYKETDVAVSQRSMKKFLDNQNEFEVDKEWIQIQRDLNIKEF